MRFQFNRLRPYIKTKNMKHFLITILFISSLAAYAQKNTYHKKGIAVEGYDVVAYFNGKARQGNKDFFLSHSGVTYYFTNQNNKKAFQEKPEKYLPQYGGFCAYAMGVNGKKVSINPETFEVREGKLYLFYNKRKTNTLELWRKGDAEKLKQKADKNWKKISTN